MLNFENGYSLTLEAGLEIAMFIAIDKPPEQPTPPEPELLELATDVADRIRNTSWDIGALRRLRQYIDREQE